MQVRPTLAEVRDIVAIDDPVLRNLQITRCYRDLAVAVCDVVGHRDVNWLAFGSWASGTAGAAIRGEGLLVDWGTSRAVAEGNRAIIEDVAPRFVRWLEEIAVDGAPTRAALERAVADPIFESAPLLASALEAYQAAHEVAADHDLAHDPAADKLHAELVLLGNVRVAAHEQEFADHLIDAAMPLGGLFGLITTRFVTVVTPDGPLDVARDVPCPSYLLGRQYPVVLDQLTHQELVELAHSYGQCLESDVSASNALTWECLYERMGYILCFFRAFQRDVRYFDVPAHFIGDG